MGMWPRPHNLAWDALLIHDQSKHTRFASGSSGCDIASGSGTLTAGSVAGSLGSIARGAASDSGTASKYRATASDDRIVIALSDANLGPYGILPSMISEALTSQADVVQAYAVFIGEPRAAHSLARATASGRASVRMHGHCATSQHHSLNLCACHELEPTMKERQRRRDRARERSRHTSYGS